MRNVYRVMMMASLALTIWLSPPVARAAAEKEDEHAVTSINIVDFGIYMGKLQPTELSDPTGRTVMDMLNSQLIRRTTGIPAKLGLEFGMEYVVLGPDLGKEVELDARLFMPGIPRKSSNRKTYQSYWQKKVKLGEKSYSGFGFDAPEELVPGEWTLQLLYKGQHMVSKTFIVYLQ